MNGNQYFSASSSGRDVHISMLVDRIDQSMSDDLKAQMINQVGSHKGDVIVDMSTVSFIDSSGIGALVGLRKKVAEGSEVRLRNSSEFVQKILKLTKLDRVFVA